MLQITADPVPLAVDEHGQVMIAGTRITLDTVIACYRRGDLPQEIAAGFPSLSLADIHAVIAYYLRHQAAVDAYLQQNRQAAGNLQSEIEVIQGSQPSRQDLESRQRPRHTDADFSQR